MLGNNCFLSAHLPERCINATKPSGFWSHGWDRLMWDVTFSPHKTGLLSRPPPPDLGRLLDFKVCPRPALPRGFGGRNRPGLFLEVPQDAVRHPHLCLLPSTLIKPLMPFHLQHTGCIYKNYKTSMKVFNALWSLRGSSYSLHILLSNKNESVVIKSINNYILFLYFS